MACGKSGPTYSSVSLCVYFSLYTGSKLLPSSVSSRMDMLESLKL